MELVFCSKSSWHPAMRREHALARAAVRHGDTVTFVEAPRDVRELRSGARHFLTDLVGTRSSTPVPGVRVIPRSTPVPGHRGGWAEDSDAWLLRRLLRRQTPADVPTVGNLPWQWPALSERRRAVFDCADDWFRLYPEARHPRFADLFRRIADQADAVVVAASDLGELFPGREVTVVPNGADASEIATTPAPLPGLRRLVYVGTLSERFDSPLVGALLQALGDWTLDLYGPCHYAGHGDAPAPELVDLLADHRVHWHGPVPRAEVPMVIDAADVVIVPNRPGLSVGQSSMKLFDVAARGRPAVVADGVSVSGGALPPGTAVAGDLGEWVDSVRLAPEEPVGVAVERLAWAGLHTWDHRWPHWATAVVGPGQR